MFEGITGRSRVLLDALLDGPKSTAELAELLGTQHVATYVMRLRKALGEPGLVHTTFTGYRLELPVRPAPVFQLPAPVGGFVGRADELSAVAAGLPGTVVISGPPGIGKTALAVMAGHLVRNRFPGGQLYVNLRGYSPSPPLTPAEVLSRFVRSLGVENAADPAAEYRRLTRGGRILVVLDNAVSVEQVLPLLPSDPSCGVLITSRSTVDLGVSVRLGTLRPDEAHELLGTEPWVPKLAEWCGYYPLALRIALGNLVGQPDVESSVDEMLASDRLPALAVDGDTEVRRTFDLSYAALDPDSAELFRLLGAVPGQDFSTAGASALLGRQAELDRLVSANLVQRLGDDRFALHDLLREYALERAGDVSEARLRLLRWYLSSARAVGAVLFPEIAPPVAGLLPDVDTAVAWLGAERANVLAAIEHCARTGPAALSWELADAIGGFLGAGGNGVEYVNAASAALAAARAAEDRAAEAQMLIRIASAYRNRGELRRALELLDDLDVGSPWLANIRGTLQLELGDLTAAAVSFREVCELAGTPTLRVGGQYGLSTIDVLTGEFSSAAARLRASLELTRERGLANLEATCLTFLALCHAAESDFDPAISMLRKALALRDRRGTANLRAGVLSHLTLVLCKAGRLDEARETVTQALDTVAVLGGMTRIEAEVHHAHGVVLRALGLASAPAFELSLELALAASSPFDEMRARAGLGDLDGARAVAARHGFRLLEEPI